MAVLTRQAAWRWPERAGCVDLYMSLGFFFSSTTEPCRSVGFVKI